MTAATGEAGQQGEVDGGAAGQQGGENKCQVFPLLLFASTSKSSHLYIFPRMFPLPFL